MNPYNRAFVFSIMTIFGMAVVIFSLNQKNYILLAASILFALVSADNIFCGFKKNKKKKR